MRGERADAPDGQQCRPHRVVGRRAQPLLVERRDAGQHLLQPLGPGPGARVAHQVVAVQVGEALHGRERHVADPLELSPRPALAGQPTLARGREPRRRVLSEREEGGTLGQRGEPDLVQPLGHGQEPGHRGVAARDGQECRPVFAEAEPAVHRGLDRRDLVSRQAIPDVDGQCHARDTVESTADLGHHGLVRVGRMRKRLAHRVASHELVTGAGRETGERAQRAAQVERRSRGQERLVHNIEFSHAPIFEQGYDSF